jgi:hypothetical protein
MAPPQSHARTIVDHRARISSTCDGPAQSMTATLVVGKGDPARPATWTVLPDRSVGLSTVSATYVPASEAPDAVTDPRTARWSHSVCSADQYGPHTTRCAHHLQRSASGAALEMRSSSRAAVLNAATAASTSSRAASASVGSRSSRYCAPAASSTAMAEGHAPTVRCTRTAYRRSWRRCSSVGSSWRRPVFRSTTRVESPSDSMRSARPN